MFLLVIWLGRLKHSGVCWLLNAMGGGVTAVRKLAFSRKMIKKVGGRGVGRFENFEEDFLVSRSHLVVRAFVYSALKYSWTIAF